MSDHQPPSGTPEYLEYGSGGPIPPEAASPADQGGRGGRRRAWWIGGGVVALLGLGGGAWAALSFFQQGAQPAEALPSTTFGYLSVDLDPSGGQKIDAFRTLNKFPAFKDQVGVDSVDELRHKIGDELISGADCSGLDYDRDIDSWLGDRMAAAGVQLAGDKPTFVVVVQVKDEGKAKAGIEKLNACDDSGEQVGFAIHDGWAVLAQTQKDADDVVTATDQGTLADDADYQKWTKAVGDPGVINAYASPDAGRVLSEELGSFFGSGIFSPQEMSASTRAAAVPSAFHAVSDDTDNPFTQQLSGFKGGAATVRFTGDGLELSVAGDGSSPQLSTLTSATGGELVSHLPADTAAAVGVSLPEGWFNKYVDNMSQMLGGMSRDELYGEISQETGLDVPDDINTLLGSGVALSIGKDFDFEAAENSDDGSGLPIAASVKGDADAISAVLDKIQAKVGDQPALGHDSSGDVTVIGPSSDYNKLLLGGGDLGDDSTFRSVVPDATHASWLVYVNIDALEASIEKAAAGDQETIDNVTPLRAVGMSAWNDNGTARFSLQVSTN